MDSLSSHKSSNINNNNNINNKESNNNHVKDDLSTKLDKKEEEGETVEKVPFIQLFRFATPR